jgi:hypothetical protein
VRMGCRDPVQRPLSTTALEWRELRQGGNEQSCEHHEGRTKSPILRPILCTHGVALLATGPIRSRATSIGAAVPDKTYIWSCVSCYWGVWLCAIGCCAIYWVVQGFVATWFV